MKKICFIFIIFSLFVFAGCGDSKNEKKEETPDSTDTVSDGDNDSADSESGDTETTDTDSDNTDTEPAEKPDQDKPEPEDDGDTTPDDPDTDEADTTPEMGDDDTADTGDSQPDEEADTGIVEPTEEEKCAAAGGTWHDTDETCTCVSGYFWNGTACAELPECSKTSGSPCKDPSTELIWSEKASGTKQWDAAVAYCEDLTEGGYDDWHLPDIDELKTLLIAETVQSDCQVSVPDCLSNSCWSCSTCTETNCNTGFTDGRFSKFGATEELWSSSVLSTNTFAAWYIDFVVGGLFFNNKTYADPNVRCVR